MENHPGVCLFCFLEVDRVYGLPTLVECALDVVVLLVLVETSAGLYALVFRDAFN